MSNIRPIADPSLTAAMVATFQSIDDARSAPSGMSTTRWRILKCIAKAAPNVPSPGELRLCSGLSKAALAEHLQALRWKGLVEMDGYRLSPSAAEMVGLENPYPPKEAKTIVLAGASPEAEEKLRDAIAAIGVKDMPIIPAVPTIIGVDIAREPDVAVEVWGRYRDDGGIDIIKIDTPLTPADVPACMRPDCTAPPLDHAISTSDIAGPRTDPRQPLVKSRAERAASRTRRAKAEDHGRGSAAAAHPTQGGIHRDRVAPDSAPRAMEEVAGSNPAPGQPTKPTISAPPAEPPKPTTWIEQRHQRIAGAIAFLKSQAILVTVVDRDAPVRTYRASSKKYSLLAEEIVELAIAKGWSE